MTALIVFGAEYLMFIIALVCAVMILRSPRRYELIAFSLVAIVAGWGLARLLGLLWYDPQPFALYGFEPLVPQEVENGFPSDHTLGSGIAASVAYLINARLGLALWAAALLVGLARAAAGLHHAVDIFAGALLAAAVVFVLHRALIFLRR